ncbi:uncharacterized protein LY89DRAFT_669143 [Mollisia scopiformis]|uniref:Cyclochlorotine biosynthesis protein O n=1 Tax=Mollisia scopiformis TaxID=149040 RepID=A0A194X926_MOLSC|nr:uncharacterized protein LY89DRAFT_669143 [Mollisia scopiformis]KUJ16675.1 hypothetical protein LY89DRAFT_669143 [Mollisia scopiformis]
MSSHEYQSLQEPLMLEEKAGLDDRPWTPATDSDHRKGGKHQRSLIVSLIILPWLLFLMLGPVQHLLEYQLTYFHTGVDDNLSEYMGEPSHELDANWSSLYPSVYQLIPKEEAEKLYAKTMIFPHDKERRYVIELDVFHQLHCLNMIRQTLRPDYYKPYVPGEDGEDLLFGHHHIDHCVETIRQALVCASDVTVYTWHWDYEVNAMRNQFATPHTCRNFEKIREWAAIYGGEELFDDTYREMNDPLDPATWVGGYSGE